MQNNNSQKIYEAAREYIAYLTEHREEMTEDIRKQAMSLYSSLCNALGMSEHSGWGVKWTLFKRHNEDDVEPYEVIEGKRELVPAGTFFGNIILDGGANQMLKLIFGIKPSTPYDNANARIFVGSDSTPERADQRGILAMGSQQASAAMDSGYPQVSPGGRTAVARATFGNSAANFAWNEVSLMNGQGGPAVALNRKQAEMGVKSGGVWTVQLEVSIVEVS